MRIGVLALLTLAAGGCYRYGSVSPSEVRSPDIVRVELTDQGTVNVTQALGTNVQVVEGNVAQGSTSALALNVTSVRRRGETLYREWPPGDVVTFPTADLRSVSRRTPDRGRTAALIAGAGGAAIATIIVVAKSGGLFSGGGTTKPPPAVRPR